MKGLTKLLLGGLAVILLTVVIILALNRPEPRKLGSVQTGFYSTLATSSSVDIGEDSVDVLFPSTASVTDYGTCASRIISTTDALILIQFRASAAASTSLQDYVGMSQQGASTTVAYDGGIYGCGAWTVRSGGNGSSTVNIAEFR